MSVCASSATPPRVELICRDALTALNSLAGYYQTTEKEIRHLLSPNLEQAYFSEPACQFPFDTCLYQYVNSKFSSTAAVSAIHWFHGTRCVDPLQIQQKGLLPLQQIAPCLAQTLDQLACQNHIAPCHDASLHSCAVKVMDAKFQNPGDLGPCATLNKQILHLPSTAGYHDYCDVPEFIDDYAQAYYGLNADRLVNLYKEKSSPVIVEFKADPHDKGSADLESIVAAMLYYVYRSLHGEEDEAISCDCSTNYSALGNRISPERIVRIYTR